MKRIKEKDIEVKKRIPYGFGSFLKLLVSNNINYSESSEIEAEARANEIEKQEDPECKAYLENLVKTPEYNVQSEDKEKNKKIKIEKAKHKNEERNYVANVDRSEIER